MNQCRLFFRKGNRLNLPSKAPIGEPLYCVDTNELYVGMGDSLPPKPIQDQTKWLIETFENYGVGIKHRESINISSQNNVKLSAMIESGNPIIVELGGETINGKSTYALYPVCLDFSDEPYVDLGTEVNPFNNIWIGRYKLSTAKNINTLTNGFTEQWGRVYANPGEPVIIELEEPYKDLMYNVQITLKSPNQATYRLHDLITGSFKVTVSGSNAEIYWRTIGII